MVTGNDDVQSKGALTQSGAAEGCWGPEKRFQGERSPELIHKGVDFYGQLQKGSDIYGELHWLSEGRRNLIALLKSSLNQSQSSL